MKGCFQNEKPTHLDLFSGIGGFSLAFEAEGFKTIGFAEIDPYASAVLRKHWPEVQNYGDVRNVPRIACDVITGGFPCQPFSSSGLKRGKSDDRFLWPAMRDIIQECQPAWVCCENVAGIIDLALDEILDDLEGIGYEAQTFIVPACAVDAHHIRSRVWIIAYTRGEFRSLQQVGGLSENSSVFADDGEIRSLADSDSGRPSQSQGGKQKQRGRVINGGENVADPKHNGHSEQKSDATEPESNRKENRLSLGVCEWTPEPELGRVAHGIPNRAYRLKCLGNSIVPQVAQVFARAIYQQITLTAKA